MKSWWERDHDFPFRASADEDLETEETEDEGTSDEKKFQQLLKGSWHHLSDEAKDAYRLRMQKLRDRIVIHFFSIYNFRHLSVVLKLGLFFDFSLGVK